MKLRSLFRLVTVVILATIAPMVLAQSVKPVAKFSFSGSTGVEFVYSFEWGLTNSGTFAGGGGGGAGKVDISDLSFTKPITPMSPQLMNACATGQHFAQARLDILDAKGNTTARITMSDVLFSSYQTSGGSDGVVERVSVDFAQMQYQIVP
jgi:type VI secretion system secreted protein Hcp